MALGVTGMLLFDGFRFSQQFEAPLDVLMALFDRIKRDIRHFDVRLLNFGAITQRRFKDFGMGYTALKALDSLDMLEGLSGSKAMDTFMDLL